MTGVATAAGSDDDRTVLYRVPSLWIHGAGLSGQSWREMTRELPRAVCPDLPGHGTAPLVDPPRVERFAETLLPDLPEAGILIGHSLGGMVALELAARMPQQVAALILIEAVPTVRDRRLQLMVSQMAVRVFTRLPPKAIAWLSGLGQQPAAQREVRGALARLSKASLAAALEAAVAYDGRDRLAQITVPTLVVCGRDNRATQRGAALMAETIANAQHVRLPGGHLLPLDNPVGLRAAIEAFLSTHLA